MDDIDRTVRTDPYIGPAGGWGSARSLGNILRREGVLLRGAVDMMKQNTALTERLATRGKVGAEEITDVVGQVFGQLLGVAATYGGDLWKWGGDAVLLYFAEPYSAARAARICARNAAEPRRPCEYQAMCLRARRTPAGSPKCARMAA